MWELMNNRKDKFWNKIKGRHAKGCAGCEGKVWELNCVSELKYREVKKGREERKIKKARQRKSNLG